MRILVNFVLAPVVQMLDSAIHLIITIQGILSISIYTLNDLSDLSNLIGSLSRTIEQYLPPASG